jgi:hypothetical protein
VNEPGQIIVVEIHFTTLSADHLRVNYLYQDTYSTMSSHRLRMKELDKLDARESKEQENPKCNTKLSRDDSKFD